MNKLLQKAKKSSNKAQRRTFTKDELELAKAWAKGEITLEGLKKALDFTGNTSSYVFIARAWAFIERK